MRVYMHVGESTFAQQMTKEWLRYSSIAAVNVGDADVFWVDAATLDSFSASSDASKSVGDRKVVLTVDHIDPTKFDKDLQKQFEWREDRVDWYHVPCGRTAQLVRQLTMRPIFVQPYWVNSRVWYTKQKDVCRELHNLPQDKFLIGSFRRDVGEDDQVNGSDIFCDVVSKFDGSKKHDVHVLLVGEGRDYIVGRLDEAGIPYTHVVQANSDVINDLYNALDLYVISSRCDGGPRAAYECAATLTQVMSTPVGFVENIIGVEDVGPLFQIDAYEKIVDLLKKVSINGNYDRVMEYFIPVGMGPFVRLFGRIVK